MSKASQPEEATAAEKMGRTSVMRRGKPLYFPKLLAFETVLIHKVREADFKTSYAIPTLTFMYTWYVDENLDENAT